MIGNNTIEMNQATVNAAIEYYLNNVVLKEPVTVKDVTKDSRQYSAVFTVSIGPKTEAASGS